MAADVDAVIAWLSARLQYRPQHPELFCAALTHRSASSHNNERLEFLGDAVLNLLIAERLYELFPRADEGDLSRLRARIVSREPLAQLAQRLGTGDVLQLGPGESKSGGHRRQSILADALEALLGAIYLDAGLAAARDCVRRWFEPLIATLPEPAALKDPKTRLQEWLQSRGAALPRYEVTSVAGAAHAQTFVVECAVDGYQVSAAGSGSSRRRAEQQAAAAVLARLQRQS
ncbi:MAG: ribonuclease III [Steroidobacteraceae bacterium]|nr:ribonuclease III [Steroidobacteraceae bacterium]MDW8258115.1 ribonuclease III [Gammaproteobacteria bacterium]